MPKALAWGYIRVSLEKQARSGLGLDAQRTAIRQSASQFKLHLVAIRADAAVKGGLPMEKRPALWGLYSREVRHGGVLIVAKRDRLGRDMDETRSVERRFREKGIRILSAVDEGTWREEQDSGAILHKGVIDLMAEVERVRIGERTKAAMAELRRRGKTTGNPPYGWRAGPGGVLVPHAREQWAIRWVRKLKSAGWSYRQIALEFIRKGIRSRNGKKMEVHQVWRIARGRLAT